MGATHFIFNATNPSTGMFYVAWQLELFLNLIINVSQTYFMNAKPYSCCSCLYCALYRYCYDLLYISDSTIKLISAMQFVPFQENNMLQKMKYLK